ncbi:DUF3458 domain-containing protein [Phenylobacterium sp.]|uniref:DUF3458 domain-containing protein n=1 Tax=Phenylobacterium sp. TaxID=1871053 RepID=UPI002ED8DADF
MTRAAPRHSDPDRLDADYTPPPFTIDYADLSLELDPQVTEVTAHLTFRRIDPEARDLVLDGHELELVSSSLDGRALSGSRVESHPDRLVVRDAPPHGTLSLRLRVRPGGPGLEGLIRLDDVLVTHCEPEGFRRICYFIDRPDVMACYRVTLIADEAAYPTLLCNGELVEASRLVAGRHAATFVDDIPKSSYLFALAAGRFDTLEDSFTTRSGRTVSIVVHAAPGETFGCALGLETLKAAMAWDERTFGVEYERSRFTVVIMRNYPGGGMENPSLNLYATEFFQADPAFSTDPELRRIASSVAHEYFHEWSGNRVGCKSWLDLTVKEGLTVLRQQRFMADLVGADARIDDVVFLRANQYPEDDGELAHPIRPASAAVASNLYTRTVYEKGAETLRMLSAWTGEAVFDEAVRAWFGRFDGRAGSVEDFLDVVADVAGEDLTAFRAWYRLAGPLGLQAEIDTDPREGPRRLILSQAPPEGPAGSETPLPIPVSLALVAEEGLPVEAPLVRMIGKHHEIELPTGSQGAVVSLLRGHSAEVRLHLDRAPEDLALLARRETDVVVRWDAAQELARQAAHAWLSHGATSRPARAWLELAGALLADPTTNPAFVGRALALPPEAALGLGQDTVDVEALGRARHGLAAAGGRMHPELLARVYDDLRAPAREPSNFGARRLRNLALEWCACAGFPDVALLALSQLAGAPTMEDQSAAFRVLLLVGGAARDEGVAVARRRWSDDPRKLDNLFAVEGANTAPDAAVRVRALLEGPDFDLDQAVRVKALLDAFGVNQGGFHVAGGAGYDAMGEAIARLGARNPRLAARFLKPFAGLGRFDATRRQAMAQTLRRLDARPDLAIEPRNRLRTILATARQERS